MTNYFMHLLCDLDAINVAVDFKNLVISESDTKHQGL